MLDDRWRHAAGYQTLQALDLPLRSGESVHRVHHRFEQYSGWVSANNISANGTQRRMFTDPVFMHDIRGVVMRAINHSIVSSQLILGWFHPRFTIYVKGMQAFRPEPIPQGFPNSKSWISVIFPPFKQSGGKVSGYRMNGAFRGHYRKVQIATRGAKMVWGVDLLFK
jgi:hypothetical protein